jgi:tRNA dimethylallyltransferase
MIAAGWLDEVGALRGHLGPTAASAVGYRELTAVVEGRATLSEARVDVIGATRRFAKRQRTYFRRDPRIRWLPWKADLEDRVADAAAALEEASWSS